MRLSSFLIIVVYLTSFQTSAQNLSEPSTRLQKVYEKFHEVEDAPEWHYRFIDAFPDNKEVFMDIFNAPEKDELFSVSHEYIMAFKHSGTSYPDIALHKCLLIDAELIAWSKGPVDDLQKTTYFLALNNVDTFIQVVNLFNKKAISSIAHFLTCSNGFDVNPNYTKLIALLESREQKRLVKIFKREIPSR